MNAILAIDAAWTASQPSGVALVKQGPACWECVAVAPSYDSFVGIGNGTPVNWNARKSPRGSQPDPAKLLDVAHRLLGSTRVSLVTVDLPVATIPIADRRVADNSLSRAFGQNGCGTHSPNSDRPGLVGIALKDGFAGNGFPIAAADCPVGTPHRLVEVYPHPALLRLLNVTFRVCYKVSKRRDYWQGCMNPRRKRYLLKSFRNILDALKDNIASIDVPLPRPGLSFAFLKRFEDALDALICAWVGIMYLAGRAQPYGDNTAAIWNPL